MVKIPEKAIAATYAQFMEEVKVRLEAARRGLHEAYERHDQGQSDSYLMAEFAVLQVRRITELIALAVLVAHNEIEDFRTNRFVDEWNADAIFKRLGKLSDTAFPEPFTIAGTDEKTGMVDILVDKKDHLTKSEMAAIYHKCGRQLHAGALKSLVKGNLYDLGEVQGWCKRIVQLLDHHVVFLPEMKKSMIVIMAHLPDGEVSCALHTLSKQEAVGQYATEKPEQWHPPELKG